MICMFLKKQNKNCNEISKKDTHNQQKNYDKQQERKSLKIGPSIETETET